MGRASAGRSGATRFSARGRRIRAAGEIAIWPCSSAQLQKARTTDVTFCRVRGERSPYRSMTSRRSSIGDVDRLLVGEGVAHPGEYSLVVAECRLRRAVLVAEPAEVGTYEVAERCRAVALVLHGFADDPCSFAERQATVGTARLRVTDFEPDASVRCLSPASASSRLELLRRILTMIEQRNISLTHDTHLTPRLESLCDERDDHPRCAPDEPGYRKPSSAPASAVIAPRSRAGSRTRCSRPSRPCSSLSRPAASSWTSY